MKINWTISFYESDFGCVRYGVYPKDENGKIVKGLIWSDTLKPCAVFGMTFERAIEYANKCKREMPYG